MSGSLVSEKSSQSGKRNISVPPTFLVRYVLARFHAPHEMGRCRNVLNLGSYLANFEGRDVMAIDANLRV